MRALKTIGIFLLAVVAVAVVCLGGYLWFSQREVAQQQDQLDPFYAPPSSLPSGPMGSIIRQEPLTTVSLSNATAYRVLYLTEQADGTPSASGAMLLVPNGPAPPGGRKVLSWAHPTVGMGAQCAPSRTADPGKPIPWAQTMVDRGWIVAATDYAGLGTPGTESYLVGQGEANDVINSVRMARLFPNAHASTTYAVYGHSQGGHASMWVGKRAAKYAPELRLAGVAAAAPATELVALLNQQWNQALSWVIGPEVLVSYPAAYPELNPADVTTTDGQGNYQQVAADCVLEASLIGAARTAIGQQLFARNPADNAAWRAAVEAQTPRPLPASVPVMISESTNDGVVPPNTIALMEQKWCKAGSAIQVNWLGPLQSNPAETHMVEGVVGGQLAVSWIQARFDGARPQTSCAIPPPVAPYAP